MNFSETFFGMPLESVTIEEVESFFKTAQNESNTIEFKSYPKGGKHDILMNSVLKTISAMSNSDGGLIIWGAPKSKVELDGAGRKIDVFQGELLPVTHRESKDRFISRVGSLIIPTPPGIKLKEINTGTGEYVYLIEVEKSPYSPHQFDNAYYMRMDGHTRPSPHHFVEALFRKVTFPTMEGYLTFPQGSIEVQQNNVTVLVKLFLFNLSKFQNVQNLYYRVLINQGSFCTQDENEKTNIKQNGSEFAVPLAKEVLYYDEGYGRDLVVQINLDTLHRNNDLVEFILCFGGKEGPLKMSKYRVYFDFIKHIAYPKIREMEENLFVFENNDPSRSERDRINQLLGR